MDVREAEVSDLAYCAALSASVQTTHVWQLRLAYDPITVQADDELGGVLHCTRLPRPVMVQPASAEPLDALWARAADVLVAEQGQELSGYVVLTIDNHQPAVSIARLVVAPQQRRAGVGGALLRAALQWTRASGFETLVAHSSARNYPATNFYLRRGLRFVGYSEAFYPRGEVALFFQKLV